MESGRPSATAYGAALHRATHQLLDIPRVFNDPLALRVLGAELEAALREDPARFDHSRSLRAFVALRSRHAEDALADAVARGVRQYVILGAGLDTFAYRNPHSAVRLRLFEVDHPATQAWKRRQLAAVGIAIPPALTYAPADFERQTLADALNAADFRAGEPAFFSLLGVTIYLTVPSVMATLRYVASLPAGSEIVFDYGMPPYLRGERERAATRARAERAAAAGEPWITYFEPSALAADLCGMGYSRTQDLGPEEANARYFSQRSDGLRIAGGGRLMKARV